MATFNVWENKDGSISCRGEIRIKRARKVVWRESETFRRRSEREARKLAERWANNRESELDRPGVLDELIRERDQPAESVTVSELIGRYREAVFPLRPWGRSKEDTLNQIQNSDFGDLDSVRVVSTDIIDHCRRWSERSSPATAMQHYIYIRGVFSVARDLLRVPVDYSQVDAAQKVMTKLGIIAKSAQRERRPSVEEMTDIVRLAFERRMVQRARNSPRSDLIAMDKVLVFAMFSGRRQDEIGRITRSGTDYERQRVLVPDMKHPTKKRGNDVWCSVPDRAWRVLMSMPQSGDEDRWFPYFARSLGDRFRDLLKQTGHYAPGDDADNLRFHDLRHECASCLFELNGFDGQVWDVPRVADVTGHQDWGSLQRYTQIAQTEPYDKWAGWEWCDRVLE